MNEEDDLEYFQRRAEEELELAQKADVPAVVSAHYELAENYLDRVDRNAAEAAEGDVPPPGEGRGG